MAAAARCCQVKLWKIFLFCLREQKQCGAGRQLAGTIPAGSLASASAVGDLRIKPSLKSGGSHWKSRSCCCSLLGERPSKRCAAGYNNRSHFKRPVASCSCAFGRNTRAHPALKGQATIEKLTVPIWPPSVVELRCNSRNRYSSRKSNPVCRLKSKTLPAWRSSDTAVSDILGSSC